MRRTGRLRAAALTAGLVLATTACSSGEAEPSPQTAPSPTGTTAATTATPATTAPPTAPTTRTAPAPPATTAPPAASGPLLPSGETTLVEGLEAPWGLAFLPDRSALVSERDTGLVKLVTPSGDVSTIGEVPGVVPGGEGGLLGLAVAPTFSRDRWLYAYLTAADDNRVVRMRYSPDGLGPPQVVVDGIAKAGIHNGGRMVFGPDGLLYVGTGDAADPGSAQDDGSLNGKVLRLRPDGSVPPDNPFGSPVWSTGHRNVQGLAFDEAGRLWAAEFGQREYDELNVIVRGGDYGWPDVEGPSDDPAYVAPVTSWQPTRTSSPSGIAELRGNVFVAALAGQRLWAVPVRDGRATGDPVSTLEGLGRLRTVAVAPDGSLWVMTSNTDGRGDPRPGDDRILRVTLAPA